MEMSGQPNVPTVIPLGGKKALVHIENEDDGPMLVGSLWTREPNVLSLTTIY
jgi:hypothetical protein